MFRKTCLGLVTRMISEYSIEGSLIAKAHDCIVAAVKPGETVVDATLGNGHDTLFLVNCVGEGGKVIGFDVQQDAIKSTAERLTGAGIDERSYELHLQSHAEILRFAQNGLSAVMFNLGYLPGGDKEKITKVDSTLKALADSLELLKSGGVLTVMCYPGHSGGDDEAEAVKLYLAGRHGTSFSVSRFHRKGATETTPFLLVVRK